MIRVIIADDHHLVRQGIRALLEKAGDIEVVAEAEDGQAAVELTKALAPDVVVMDIGMPRLNGTEATAHIQTLDVESKVIILSMHSDRPLIRETLKNGAKGYLLKRSVKEELLLAIRTANHNEIYLSPAISNVVVDQVLTGEILSDVSRLEDLTSREREVLQLVAEGYTTKAIAQTLSISTRTVEKHRTSLMEKLNIHDIAGLTRFAVKQGLIFLDE